MNRNDAEREGRYLAFVHIPHIPRSAGGYESKRVLFRAFPRQGEYVTLTVHGEWFQVTQVLHCAVEDDHRTFDVEVWLKPTTQPKRGGVDEG